jgi:hypothetical protein
MRGANDAVNATAPELNPKPNEKDAATDNKEANDAVNATSPEFNPNPKPTEDDAALMRQDKQPRQGHQIPFQLILQLTTMAVQHHSEMFQS